MSSSKKKTAIKVIVVLVGVAALAAALWRLNSFEKTEMVSTKGYSYERAIVTEVVTDNLQENGERVGYQHIKVRMLTGEHKGEIYDATSSEGNLFGATCHVSDKVIVTFSVSGDTATVGVYSKDRSAAVIGFVAVFLLFICLIGGRNGVKSVLGLVFTFAMIIFMFLPMIYLGMSPFWAAVIVVIVTTIATMYLIGGNDRKTLSAILGTTLGVLIAGISAWIFGLVADIDGYNVSDIETLIYLGQNTSIDVGGLLFAGILIAALGAVMDVAMSVSSAIAEIHDKSPKLGVRQLFRSGMNVGRDMMGTMSNTLILAFAGGSISVLVLDYSYDLPMRQILNSYSIGIEIMQGIAGSIGVILTVPTTAAMAALLYGKIRKPAGADENDEALETINTDKNETVISGSSSQEAIQ